MRWLAVLALSACAAPRPHVIESHCAVPAFTPAKDKSRYEELPELVQLPDVPKKRGLDRSEERACRAQYERVLSGAAWDAYDMQHLARLAIDAGGDCRIDTDALLGQRLYYHLGGCSGATPHEALPGWSLVAAVATTRERRVIALRNVAALAWRIARYEPKAEAWIDAGDRYLTAAAADPDELALSTAAVDAYERAAKLADKPTRAKIGARLERVTDGAAADRARALRDRLR